jgi:hypothetical protein
VQWRSCNSDSAILNDDPHAGVGNSESNLSIQSFIAFNRSIKQIAGRGIFRSRFGGFETAHLGTIPALNATGITYGFAGVDN